MKNETYYENNYHYSPGANPPKLRRDASDLIAKALAYKDGNSFLRYQQNIEQHALNLTNGHCFYCNRKMVAYFGGKSPEVMPNLVNWDHFIPAAQWGVFALGNIVASCFVCNSEKSDIDPIEYWQSRKDNKLELRFKTLEEINSMKEKLEGIYKKELAKLDFVIPTRTFDSFNDVISFWVAINDSEIVKGLSKNGLPSETNPRWMKVEREDAAIWSALNDTESYVYENFGEEKPVGIAYTSRIDVKGRVSRAIEHLNLLHGENTSITSLTEEEFKVYSKSFVNQLTTISANEGNKAKRLIRALAQTNELNAYHNFAWNGLKKLTHP